MADNSPPPPPSPRGFDSWGLPRCRAIQSGRPITKPNAMHNYTTHSPAKLPGHKTTILSEWDVAEYGGPTAATMAEYPALSPPYEMAEYVAGKACAERIRRHLQQLAYWLEIDLDRTEKATRQSKGNPVHHKTLAKLDRAFLIEYRHGIITWIDYRHAKAWGTIIDIANRPLD